MPKHEKKISINHANIADLLLHGHILFLKIYTYYSSCTFYHYYFPFSFWTTRRDGSDFLLTAHTPDQSLMAVRWPTALPNEPTTRLHLSLPCDCPFIEWYFRSYHLLHILPYEPWPLYLWRALFNFVKLNSTPYQSLALAFLVLGRKTGKRRNYGVLNRSYVEIISR